MSDQSNMGFIEHLKELKNRITYSLVVVGVLFLSMIYFANRLYLLLAAPLIQSLPNGSQMIATDVMGPLLAPLKFVFVLSIFISMPFLLYQLWLFIAPALFKHEKKLLWPILLSSTILFYLGTLFAYFIVFPVVFGFLMGIAPSGVAVMPDISQYLGFVIKLFFAFGLCFEVPVAVFLLVRSGMVSVQTLREKRPFVIVGAFVVGMLLTPPDVISQIMLAIPICLLYEAGLFFSDLTTRQRQEKQEHLEE